MSAVAGVHNLRENGRASSSPGLSSPPTPSSPTYLTPAATSRIHASTTSYAEHAAHGLDGAGDGSKVATLLRNSEGAVAKKPRKKRDPTTTAKKPSDPKFTANSTPPDGKEAVPKTRKPRAPNGTGPTKRKPKNATTLEDRPVTVQPLGQAKATDQFASPTPALHLNFHATPEPSRNGKNEAIDIPKDTNHIAPPKVPTPRLSGQNYDPVRSSTVQPRSFPPTPSHQVLRSSTPPRLPNYGTASNSPSISSLIDPPPSHQQLRRDDGTMELSPPPKRQRLTPPESIPPANLPVAAHQSFPRQPSTEQPVMYKEREGSANRHPDAQPVLEQIPPAPSLLDQGVPPMKTAAVKRKSTTSSGTITPATAAKNSRQKEAAMPAAPGNGLLSTEMFGGGSGNSDAERTAPTVIIDVPLNGESNKYVNFARLAEERYGFNALYPRLAVQRERLARVAAAGAALEKENKANGSGMSGDEMSVDLSEGEGAGDDSNVEMGGMGLIERDVLGAGRSPAEGSDGAVVKRKKRIMKEDQYDKDDPFVDDTELAWEEQQAASKDGFFVYSGPLVPEGEKPNVERTEATAKRGRGTGRGRGGSTRGSRGGATRGRGGATGPRKPRITKAAKETMDQEKAQRENLATLAAKPTTYPAPVRE